MENAGDEVMFVNDAISLETSTGQVSVSHDLAALSSVTWRLGIHASLQLELTSVCTDHPCKQEDPAGFTQIN
jgi:hypothetical protein